MASNYPFGIFKQFFKCWWVVPSPHVAHIVLLITTDYMTSKHQFHIIKYCLYTRKIYALFKPVSEAFIVQCDPVCIIIHVYTFCNISKCLSLCPFFFDLWLLIIPLVSSNNSSNVGGCFEVWPLIMFGPMDIEQSSLARNDYHDY
jgi:hypothetical protein